MSNTCHLEERLKLCSSRSLTDFDLANIVTNVSSTEQLASSLAELETGSGADEGNLSISLVSQYMHGGGGGGGLAISIKHLKGDQQFANNGSPTVRAYQNQCLLPLV